MKRIILPLVFVLSALTPPAFASNMTDCWMGKKTDETLKIFDCQHTTRLNYHGHRIQDVSIRGPKNDLNYSLVLWRDPDTDELEVDFILKGKSQRVDAWYDDDNDLRWDVGKYAFALRYSDAALSKAESFGPPSRSSRSTTPVDLDRPMTTGLRGRSSHSEYGL